jgi:polyisoprenoid-binding protein YceI
MNSKLNFRTMKKNAFRYIALSILTATFSIVATAQQDFILDKENSELTVSGTSNLHDWEMVAETFSGETSITMDEGNITEISSVYFTCAVADILSDKRIMNNKAHDALKEKKHPEIKFQMNRGNAAKLADGKIDLTGTLTIAGKPKTVNVTSDYQLDSGNKLSVMGEVTLKMTDFGIEPPTAMFGAVETDDKVTVKYSFKFNKSRDELSAKNK